MYQVLDQWIMEWGGKHAPRESLLRCLEVLFFQVRKFDSQFQESALHALLLFFASHGISRNSLREGVRRTSCWILYTVRIYDHCYACIRPGSAYIAYSYHLVSLFEYIIFRIYSWILDCKSWAMFGMEYSIVINQHLSPYLHIHIQIHILIDIL